MIKDFAFRDVEDVRNRRFLSPTRLVRRRHSHKHLFNTKEEDFCLPLFVYLALYSFAAILVKITHASLLTISSFGR